MKFEKERLLMLLAIGFPVLFLVLGSACIAFSSVGTIEDPGINLDSNNKIDSFEECVAQGNPPSFTNPRICISKEGKYFEEE